MGPWSRVRVAKCQMLVTSLFVLLLGLAVATAAVLTYFGPHFAVIGHASSQRTRYEALHLWAFSTGITLAALLTLGAVLSAAATVREAGGLMAGAFLCFALAFCVLVQVAFWRCHNPTQVEDAVLDAYDQVYEQAVKSSSGIWRQELVAIQDMFQCCGKSPPLGLPEGSQADLCRGQEAARQDCLQGIRNVLRMHRNIASTLISLGLASMVYVMPLSAFLWFAIRSGKYTLSPRARGCQPQEPHFYRRCREGPAPPHLSEAGAVGVQAVARVTLRCPRTPTRLHTGATETLRPWPARHPSQEGMSCFPPHGGGMGREGTPPDKQPPCKQTGDRAPFADSGNRLGGLQTQTGRHHQTGLPGPPVCRRQVIPRPHDHGSQFQIIISFYREVAGWSPVKILHCSAELDTAVTNGASGCRGVQEPSSGARRSQVLEVPSSRCHFTCPSLPCFSRNWRSALKARLYGSWTTLAGSLHRCGKVASS
ncbi:tetraspanin-32 isoform X4 [Delphinapterus leucas]|uniref:Tetraspanin-32 isoform X4 n=1 Tax=Delphinapterus leucas TaxID=9749 RepID=A0A2Y9PLY1_DELLE|nr:tetraspanin-32 isoform X4 [Delphinapterus leucas]